MQSPNIRIRESVVATDVNTPGFQRAPAEAPGFFGFECAVDELAVALGMDPVELRIKNEPARDPIKGRASGAAARWCSATAAAPSCSAGASAIRRWGR